MSGGYFRYFYSALGASIEVTSDAATRTVTVTVPVDQWVNMITLIPDYMSIVAPELTELYGGETDWRNVVGTGPFILADFVDNSTVTFVRNSLYWETDPIGPGMGNQLPYLDEYEWLIIVDPSIREAAFRSGQIDMLSAVNINEAEPILSDRYFEPLVEYKTYLPDGSYALYMRTDDPDSPFSIKEVRQAMMLAIDHDLIRDSYWQDSGEILTWPITPTTAYLDAYVPLEDMPESVQALYGRDLDAAKELLDEAGYLDSGIDCTVICWNTPTMIDILSIYQDMLADIGINMELDIKDYSVYIGITRSCNYGPYEILYASDSGNGTYLKMIDYRGKGSYNPSHINEDYSVTEIEEAYAQIAQLAGTNEPEIMRIHRELMPWLVEQAYCIPGVVPEYYTFWWPWVNNYYGTYAVGYYNYYGSAKYCWLDQDLKEAMGY
jgi:peptide/nickel transport system substrate-binding protein